MTLGISTTVNPKPLPDLPVDPADLVGRPIATVHATAKGWNSLPDPNGGQFGVGPTCDYVLTTDMPTGPVYRYEDALAQARKRTASGTEQAIFQARSGAFLIGNVRMLPRGLNCWLMGSPKAVASLDYTAKTPVLRAIVGPSTYVEFPPPTKPALGMRRARRGARHVGHAPASR